MTRTRGGAGLDNSSSSCCKAGQLPQASGCAATPRAQSAAPCGFTNSPRDRTGAESTRSDSTAGPQWRRPAVPGGLGPPPPHQPCSRAVPISVGTPSVQVADGHALVPSGVATRRLVCGHLQASVLFDVSDFLQWTPGLRCLPFIRSDHSSRRPSATEFEQRRRARRVIARLHTPCMRAVQPTRSKSPPRPWRDDGSIGAATLEPTKPP